MITFIKRSAFLLGTATMFSLSAVPAHAQYHGEKLEKAIAFDSGTAFEMKNDGSSIFDLLWKRDSINIPGAGLRKVSHSTDDSNGWVRNEIDLQAKWNGLKLRKLGYDGIENSGVGTYRMHFDDDAATVRSRLIALGMKFISDPDDDSLCDTQAQVKGELTGSVLLVSHIC